MKKGDKVRLRTFEEIKKEKDWESRYSEDFFINNGGRLVEIIREPIKHLKPEMAELLVKGVDKPLVKYASEAVVWQYMIDKTTFQE